jgi:hypothetical protein
VAGQERRRIIDTADRARAASMRAAALSADRACPGRAADHGHPDPLLGAGFLLLIVFPVVYRTLGAG